MEIESIFLSLLNQPSLCIDTFLYVIELELIHYLETSSDTHLLKEISVCPFLPNQPTRLIPGDSVSSLQHTQSTVRLETIRDPFHFQ